jgi:hypothetical protein
LQQAEPELTEYGLSLSSDALSSGYRSREYEALGSGQRDSDFVYKSVIFYQDMRYQFSESGESSNLVGSRTQGWVSVTVHFDALRPLTTNETNVTNNP